MLTGPTSPGLGVMLNPATFDTCRGTELMGLPPHTQRAWQMAWPHGRSETHALGGMTAPVEFQMLGGQVFSPLLVAPWAGQPMTSNTPGHLRNLRGVFPCLPFGISEVPIEAPDAWRRLARHGEANPQHGPGANGLWKPVANDGTELQIIFEHSKEFAFARSLQFIRPDPSAPAIDFRFTAEARRDVSLPFGHHVLLRWPEAPARIILDPAPFAIGLTYPGALIKGHKVTLPGRTFMRLDEVPAIDSGIIDFSRPRWQAQTEELVMLCGMEGRFDIAYPDEGCGLRVLWDAELLPSCLVWLSCGGLQEAPWLSRFTGIGIEPIAAAFDFLPSVSGGHNPVNVSGIATAVRFQGGRPWETSLRLEAYALDNPG